MPAAVLVPSGAGTKPQVLNEAATMDRFVSIVGRLDQEDALWGQAFGVDCPDRVGDPVDPAPRQIEQMAITTDWSTPRSSSSWQRNSIAVRFVTPEIVTCCDAI